MSERAQPFDCFYVLDAADRIVEWGGPTWQRFWAENGGKALDLGGHSLYDHVAGHFTKRFLQDFFAEARVDGEPRTRAYRCDSPAAKRLMQMRAAPGEGGLLRVEHRLMEEQPMPRPVAVSEEPGPLAQFQRCSICNRLKRSGADEWLEPESHADAPQPLRVVHTVCPPCRQGVKLRVPLRPLLQA